MQRSARGVRLTEAGEAVVRHAEAIMARLAEAEAELEAIAGLRGGRLRMAAVRVRRRDADAARDRRLPRRSTPAVELSMSLSEPEDCIPLLRSGELDLAIVFESAVVEHADDGIHRVHLIEDPMYLVLPRDHPLAHRRRVRLADLAGEAWIGGPARLRVQPADLARVRDARATSRGSPSRPTTTRPCRASSPPASASR